MNLIIDELNAAALRLNLREKGEKYCNQNLITVFQEERYEEFQKKFRIADIEIEFRRHALVFQDQIFSDLYFLTYFELKDRVDYEMFAEYKCVFNLDGSLQTDYFELL